MSFTKSKKFNSFQLRKDKDIEEESYYICENCGAKVRRGSLCMCDDGGY